MCCSAINVHFNNDHALPSASEALAGAGGTGGCFGALVIVACTLH